ncbi:MAG: hypothetical protein ACI898_001628, partial [Flavobacteriales bacterium]
FPIPEEPPVTRITFDIERENTENFLTFEELVEF